MKFIIKTIVFMSNSNVKTYIYCKSLLKLYKQKEGKKINKKILMTITILAILTLPTIQVLAINKNSKAPINGLEKSGNDHLYLFEKDSETWEIVEDPKWAKMNFNNKKNTYVLNAHGLAPEEEFELICYLDPWPGDGSIWLGEGTSDAEGNLHIKGEIVVDDLHTAAQEKLILDPENPEYSPLANGAKIWLVLEDDFDEENDVMFGWTPEEILFEFDLLTQPPIDT